MGIVRQDKIQVVLEMDASQNKTELDNLNRRQKVLTDGLKEMRRGTDEYIAASKELRQVTGRIGELQKEIGITGLSVKQLTKLQGDLKREIAGLVPGTEAFIEKSKQLREVDARVAQVRREIAGIEPELEKAGGAFGRIGNFVKGAFAFAGVQIGIDLVRDFVSTSIDEFDGAESAAAQLEATIRSTGEAAGITAQRAQEISAALEKKTTFDGDDVTAAQSLLLTFTEIKGAIYEQAVPAIADLATKMAGNGPADLKGATIQVGKALNDPIKGITALSKAGVSFSEEQKATIKTLVETGQKAEAQKIILAELAKEFGGSAEAAAAAGRGPLKQFQVQIGNAKEAVGEFIVKGLELVAPALRGMLAGFVGVLGVLRALPGFLVENRGVLGGLAVAILTLNAANIAASASTLYHTAVERGRAIVTTSVATAQRLLNAAMAANPIGLVITAVALLVGGFITLYEKSETVRAAVAGLGKAAVQVFSNIKDAGLRYLSGLGDLLVGIFTFDLDKIKAGLGNAFGGVKDLYTGAGKGAAAAFSQGYDEKMVAEHAALAEKEAKRAAERKAAAEQHARELSAADLLELAKGKEAELKIRLSRAKEDSLAELRLKQQLRQVQAEIELLDDKKSAADKAVIRAEALADIRKLERDYAEKRKQEAIKAAKEQEDVVRSITDRQINLIQDETTRKLAQLAVAAEREKAAVKGTAEQKSTQIRLIDEKLVQDQAALRKVASDKAIKDAKETAEKLVELEHQKAVALADAAVTRAERSGSPEALLAAKLGQLDAQRDAETESEKLTAEQKFAIVEKFEAEKANLRKQYLTEQQRQEVEVAQIVIGISQAGLQLVADLAKSSSDARLAQEERDKNRRLQLLDQEHKSGKISKEKYEKEKAAITANYDENVRKLKREAAQQEKQFAIAQTIMQGVLAVLAASSTPAGPFGPQAIAAGILASLSLAKVVATPIPTYADGGVFGTRRFQRGARINPVAGVPEVGQRHGEGGIQMIDGKTGQHLGEWERGEPYLILSRQTYANNRHVVDQLIDTSLYRGGAAIGGNNRRYASGGLPTGEAPTGVQPPATRTDAGAAAIVAAVQENTAAIRAIPSRLHAVIDRDVLLGIEDALSHFATQRDEARIG